MSKSCAGTVWHGLCCSRHGERGVRAAFAAMGPVPSRSSSPDPPERAGQVASREAAHAAICPHPAAKRFHPKSDKGVSMITQRYSALAIVVSALLLQACQQGPDPAKVQADVTKAQAEGQKKIVDAQAKMDQ